MKSSLVLILLLFAGKSSFAQKVDTMYINLYTDSLKKGRFNYINVEGRFDNGLWLPLDSTHIVITSDEGLIRGNDLVLPENFKKEKVTVTVALKDKPEVREQKTIFIKKEEEPPLQTEEQYLKGLKRN